MTSALPSVTLIAVCESVTYAGPFIPAEVRGLRLEVERSVARARMEADPGPGDGALTLSRSELAEAWGIGE